MNTKFAIKSITVSIPSQEVSIDVQGIELTSALTAEELKEWVEALKSAFGQSVDVDVNVGTMNTIRNFANSLPIFLDDIGYIKQLLREKRDKSNFRI